MAHVLVLGAGLGGIPLAYELREELRDEDKVTVVSDKDRYQFLPSNPWLAVNWRKPSDIEVPLAPCFDKYFLHKVRSGTSEPFYEKYVFRAIGIGKLKHGPEAGDRA